jgi:hypothetical protein
LKQLITLLAVLFSVIVNAQNVGIGETSPSESKLQVKSNDSAVLILHNATQFGSNIKSSLFFKSGNAYSGGFATIGSGYTFRMGMFTYGSTTASGLIERISILDAGNVGIGITSPSPSAKLEVSSINQGFLPPRLTIAQRNAITNPAIGLVIYCTDCDELEVFNGTIWKSMGGAAACTFPSFPNVTICDQTWMQKNLDVSNYQNGDPIPKVTDPILWSNLTTGAWCWYNNDSANPSPRFVSHETKNYKVKIKT